MIEPLRICVVGASGRMGQNLLELIDRSTAFDVGGAVVASEDTGREFGPQRVTAYSNVTAAVADSDVVVDFSTPAGFASALAAACDHGKPFVSGTTGLGQGHLDDLREAARLLPVLHAANFSVGVTLLTHLTELASRALEGFDIEIFEAHHRRKVDAPSGTALMLGRAAATGRDLELEDVARWSREGHTGPREDDEIGFQVLRGGSIPGDHTVFFCGEDERVELSHHAQDRRIFAAGALRAAAWLVQREPGAYSMKNVLFGTTDG